MADEQKAKRLEIAHVLFMDIVGYSKLPTDEESEALQELNQIVRDTEAARNAEAGGRPTILPTGDGMALVFTGSVEEPAEYALEIGRALRAQPSLPVRMGIHSGPIQHVQDANGRENIAGVGINIAQRVMDCGDAGHILVSKRVADDLTQQRRWQPYLHELGDVEVKHGVRVCAVNFYTEEVGNPAVPKKFKRAPAAADRWIALARRWAWLAFVVALIIAALAIGSFLFRSRGGPKLSAVTSTVPEKSVAVLPFVNLSEEKENAYFAEGIQDEILTRLSKIADLKVISRTSTQRFKSKPEDLPQIAKQLRVANILEGSVQKAGDQVRVNVQLINVATQAHSWAESYDRKLTDIFAVESEIARTIADTLQARLTGAEKQMIAAQPTSDTTAYELYLKGRSLWINRTGDNLHKAIAFYQQAIARDPNYALAYSGLAEAYAILPLYSGIAPREAFAKAKAAALKALQLNDRLAEAHTALAFLLCFADLDMAGSVAEFQRAIALNPNYATAHQWFGVQPLTALGRFDKAVAEEKRAIELDPLSPVTNADLGWILIQAGRYDEAIAQMEKTLEIDPTFYPAHYNLGLALQLKGDLAGAIAEYTKGQALSDDLEFPVMKAIARAQSGDKTPAVQILSDLEKLGKHHYAGGAYWRALLCLSLGNRDEAIQWLEQSLADRAGSDIVYIKVFHFLDPLRGDPRFEALVQKVVGPK